MNSFPSMILNVKILKRSLVELLLSTTVFPWATSTTSKSFTTSYSSSPESVPSPTLLSLCQTLHLQTSVCLPAEVLRKRQDVAKSKHIFTPLIFIPNLLLLTLTFLSYVPVTSGASYHHFYFLFSITTTIIIANIHQMPTTIQALFYTLYMCNLI